MTESDYSMRIRATCSVYPTLEGGRVHTIKDNVQCNISFNGRIMFCRTSLKKDIAAGDSGHVDLDIISFAPIEIGVGDEFELTAGKHRIAHCSMLQIIPDE